MPPLETLADGLAREVEAWLAEDVRARAPVRVEGLLKGGKVKCEYRLYECRRRGPGHTWEETRRWKGKVEDTVDRLVSVVDPADTPGERRARLADDLAVLVSELAGVGPEQGWRNTPVLHG
jgi:hypothetical protein